MARSAATGIARDYSGFFANDVALQLDGKSVMAGKFNGVAAVIRYNVDGSLDTAFGINGLAQLPLMSPVKGVAIDQTSGAILVCSTAHADEDGTHPAVGRLTSGGLIDTGFGNAGYAIYDVVGDHTVTADIVIQRDHKIVVVADTNDPTGIFQDGDNDILVIRYTENGQRDNTFGGDGVVQVGFGGYEYARALAIDYTPLTTDPKYGSIYFAGLTTSGGPNYSFAVGKLTPTGSTDSSFDGDGKLTSTFGGGADAEVEGITVQPGSKPVVTGTLAVTYNSAQRNFITARYTSAACSIRRSAPEPTGMWRPISAATILRTRSRRTSTADSQSSANQTRKWRSPRTRPTACSTRSSTAPAGGFTPNSA